MSLLETSPPARPQSSNEDIKYGFDLSRNLDVGQAATSLVAVLTKKGGSQNGAVVTLDDAPVFVTTFRGVAGQFVEVRVRAGKLALGAYELSLRYSRGTTTDRFETVLTLVAPH